MHFVKKEPSTEEERILREKERAIKVNKYLTARNKIFEKKRNGEYDEQMLNLTHAVLSKNPDISTLWNIRRKTLDILIDSQKDTNEYESTALKLLNGEMALTLECLMQANPKSYGAWHQRGWTLKRLISTGNTPDFKTELQTCKKALDYDCRNFHCWDHRRIVSALAKCSDKEEIEFSLDRINHNFSNYSAWHYRSVLLNPDQANTKSSQLSESFLREELDRVAQAFSCDPDDQSAFVYAQWLLSLGSRKTFSKYSYSPVKSSSVFPNSPDHPFPLSVSFNGLQTTIVWTKAVTKENFSPFLKDVKTELLLPHSSICANPKAASVWTYGSEKPLECRLKEGDEWRIVDELNPLVHKAFIKIIFDCDKNRGPNQVAEILLEKLEELKEIPPVSSWTLYTYALCIIELNDGSKHDEVVAILQDLCTKDQKRRELYEAAISRQIINQTLREEVDGKQLLERILEGKESSLILLRKKTTSLSGIEYLAGFLNNLNVAGNELKGFDEFVLPNLEYLDISENPIKRIPKLVNLRSLKSLNIASTQVECIEDVHTGLCSLPKLEKFIFPETKIVEDAGSLRQSLENDGKHLRLINYWL